VQRLWVHNSRENRTEVAHLLQFLLTCQPAKSDTFAKQTNPGNDGRCEISWWEKAEILKKKNQNDKHHLKKLEDRRIIIILLYHRRLT
jgi:hypothetical protein